MKNSADQAQKSKKTLLRHFAIMVMAVTVLQIIIALRGNKIDIVADLILLAIALYYAWFHYASREMLSRLRFGRLVAHVVGFLTVTLSYHFHAFILYVSGSEAIKGNEDFSIDQGWFGVLFGMTTFWGIGLLIHLVASISNRGFEELK